MLRRERCPTLAFPADGAADFRGKFPDDADLQHDSHSFNNRAAGARSDFSAFSRATDPNDSQIPDRREGPCVAAMVLVLGLLKRAPAGR
jgi:hypothetical protein